MWVSLRGYAGTLQPAPKFGRHCNTIMSLQGALKASLGSVRLPTANRSHRAQRRSLLVSAAQNYKIAVLSGDGIGPEITKVALKALTLAGSKSGVTFTFEEALIGGAAIDATGVPLPDETLEQCKASDAVLLAAIGGWAVCTGSHCARDVTAHKNLFLCMAGRLSGMIQRGRQTVEGVRRRC